MQAEGVALSLAWFPEADYRAAIERWPSFAEDWGDVPHHEYCLATERHLREGSRELSGPWSVSPIDIEEFVAWCEAEGLEPEEGRSQWAVHVLLAGDGIPWPPARNDPCWCGSGRKYKRCCGGDLPARAIGAFWEADERCRFAAPPAAGSLDGIDLAQLDPSDADERRLLIEADHPELRRALKRGHDEIVVDGRPINPRLHITMHEIVATQLWEDDPPAVWLTAKRLLAEGYERHEVLHMLGSAVAKQISDALSADAPVDPARYVAALKELPQSYFALAE